MADTIHELSLQGSPGVIIGFVKGVAFCEAALGEVWSCEEHCVKADTLAEKLHDLLMPHAEIIHVLATTKVRDRLTRAINDVGGEIGISLRAERLVKEARFEFSYHAYDAESGERLKELFANLPEGLVLDARYEPRESVDPSAKGIEVYAPTHHYELTAQGIVRGDVQQILILHARLREHDFVEPKPILLTREDP